MSLKLPSVNVAPAALEAGTQRLHALFKTLQ